MQRVSYERELLQRNRERERQSKRAERATCSTLSAVRNKEAEAREGQNCRPHAMKTKSKASQLGQTSGDCDASCGCDCNCDCDAGSRATEICSQLFVCVCECVCVLKCECALHANYCGKLRARAAQHKTMSLGRLALRVCVCVIGDRCGCCCCCCCVALAIVIVIVGRCQQLQVQGKTPNKRCVVEQQPKGKDSKKEAGESAK